jgi:hypothetical protein
MREQTLKQAQEFLTIVHNGETKRIIDIELLVKRHQRETILSFLKGLLKEKQKALKEQVADDKTDCSINETIAAIFRIYMAIQTLEREEKR